ncbi:retropepsin-like aspartic protease family protein [Pseudothauera rhizosphaerae]|uniref:TIGR02281 family clan AA aspartic protease n=1 Tax=Pseudothauera rhizosphaerae TaxID=2565932 RepID=A0A4S4AQM4_9RHOO|nr:TIGR02281 family clan AA aspartic protease [Pseudothauera rhizosphaerae]THF62059.1 TIGR02281 family clan AA aspartic protease [Pseudothauera rhizosphaerae]
MSVTDTTRGLGRVMTWLGALALLGVLWMVFSDQLERRYNPNRDLVVTPGSGGELVLQRNRLGHYVAPGTINGRPVVFLLDTGATQVSVPAHLGPALGLSPGAPAQVMTANGPVTVRGTAIAELALGPFLVRDVRAHLNPGIGDNQVLLGMSVLKHLEFTQRGDTLILRANGG